MKSLFLVFLDNLCSFLNKTWISIDQCLCMLIYYIYLSIYLSITHCSKCLRAPHTASQRKSYDNISNGILTWYSLSEFGTKVKIMWWPLFVMVKSKKVANRCGRAVRRCMKHRWLPNKTHFTLSLSIFCLPNKTSLLHFVPTPPLFLCLWKSTLSPILCFF